jgi:hypothetical protein
MDKFSNYDLESLSLTELDQIIGGGFWRDLGYSATYLAVEFKEAIVNALAKL